MSDEPSKDLEQHLSEMAAEFQPRQNLARLQAAADAIDRRAWRRSLGLMCVAGAIFAVGVVGLGIGLRPDEGDNAHLVTTDSSPELTPDSTDAAPAAPLVIGTTTIAPITAPTTTTTTLPPPPAGAAFAVPIAGSSSTAASSAPRSTPSPSALIQSAGPVAIVPAPTVATTPPPAAPTTALPPPTLPPSKPPKPPKAPKPPKPGTPPPTTAALVPLTAHWRTQDCAVPIFSLFFGTAAPGSVVTITSPLGSSTAQANDLGNWGRWVVFPNITGPLPVSVSSSQGTLYPPCGS